MAARCQLSNGWSTAWRAPSAASPIKTRRHGSCAPGGAEFTTFQVPIKRQIRSLSRGGPEIRYQTGANGSELIKTHRCVHGLRFASPTRRNAFRPIQ